MRAALWLHLRGGKTVAVVLPDHEAEDVVNAVLAYWRQPDPDLVELAVGAGDEPTLWLRYDEIAAVERHPHHDDTDAGSTP